MPHFLFAYHGGKQPETSEETEVEIERWRSWFHRIGPAIVDPGNPVGAARIMSADGVTEIGAATRCPATRSSIHKASIM